MRFSLACLAVRYLGVTTMLAGLAWTAADVVSVVHDEQAGVRIKELLKSLHPLSLAMVGAAASLAARIAGSPAPLRKRSPPFDLQAAVGKYLEWEGPNRWVTRVATGVALVFLAFFLGIVWGSFRDGLQRQADGDAAAAIAFVLLFLSFPVVVFRMKCLIAGLRRVAPRAETLLHRSRRQPVLYLRSFATDRAAAPWEASSMFMGWFLGWLPETFERALAKAVANVGPLVAIGIPGERLPPLGAARLYVRDGNDWKKVVAELVSASRIVVMRVGYTESFWWEFEHLTANCDPRKVVIYMPARDRRDRYAYFVERAKDHVSHPFPKSLGQAMFLGFSSGWQPLLLGVKGPSLAARLRRFFSGSPAPAVREAIHGALRQLGLNATRLRFQFREWFVIVVLPPAILMAVTSILSLFAS